MDGRVRSGVAGLVLLLTAGLCGLVLVAVTGSVRAESPQAPGAPRAVCALGGGCDTVVRVEDVWHSAAAGTLPDRVPADGLFYVVTAEVRSGSGIIARVRDADGRTYERAEDVEARVPPPPGRVRWVFDLPDWAPAPRLVLHRAGLLNRLTRSVEIPLPAPGI